MVHLPQIRRDGTVSETSLRGKWRKASRNRRCPRRRQNAGRFLDDAARLGCKASDPRSNGTRTNPALRLPAGSVFPWHVERFHAEGRRHRGTGRHHQNAMDPGEGQDGPHRQKVGWPQVPASEIRRARCRQRVQRKPIARRRPPVDQRLGGQRLGLHQSEHSLVVLLRYSASGQAPAPDSCSR